MNICSHGLRTSRRCAPSCNHNHLGTVRTTQGRCCNRGISVRVSMRQQGDAVREKERAHRGGLGPGARDRPCTFILTGGSIWSSLCISSVHSSFLLRSSSSCSLRILLLCSEFISWEKLHPPLSSKQNVSLFILSFKSTVTHNNFKNCITI